MTVQELIEVLKKAPPDVNVMIDDWAEGYVAPMQLDANQIGLASEQHLIFPVNVGHTWDIVKIYNPDTNNFEPVSN